jgi:hypothetical protein
VGGGLRISGGKRSHALTGNTDWKRVQHQFSVGEDSGDVVLVCELRAAKGQIWFDPASLQLEQVQ